MKYDVIVIGSGPGGYTAAIRAAQLGKKVALIEKGDIGGTCLNHGCIPTKALHASTKLFSKIKRADQFGISAADPTIDLSKVIDRKDRIVNQLRKGLEYLFKENKIDLVRGEATLKSPEQVLVNGLAIEAPRMILATGSSIPRNPPFKIDEKKVFSSNGILNLRSVPNSMAIIGAGAIGVEMACIFNALGSKVSLFEMMPNILPSEDIEIAKALEQYLVKKGVEIKTNTKIDNINSYEIVLVSIGRKLNTDGFENIGIKLDGGKVRVNDKMQTNIPNVYAVGDIAGKYMFAHTASREGIVAAENASGLPAGKAGKSSKMDHHAVPRCTYSEPAVASVGMTEEEARAVSKNIKIGKFPFSASSKSLIEDEREGFIKVITDDSSRILGIHILGGNATEIIGEAALAVNKGMKVEDIISTIHAHPTVYESMGEAAENVLKQAISIINR
ncbi:MAG: dihydrolipoyl dehydrogenase [bacterium]